MLTASAWGTTEAMQKALILVWGFVKDAAWLGGTAYAVWLILGAPSSYTIGQAGDAASAMVTAHDNSMRLQEFWAFMATFGTARFMEAFYAAVFLLAFWLRERNYRRRSAANLESARQLFPGFAVRQGDFEYAGRQAFRVNSDGFRVNLKKWNFDENSGEFFFIKNKIGKHIVFEATPHSQRFVADAKSLWRKAGIALGAIVIGLFSVFFMVLAFVSHDRENQTESVIALVIGLTLIFFAVRKFMPVVTNGYYKKIGPEPLPRAVPEFGVQQPHGTFADDGTI
jgi:hypothetical protein